MIFIAAVELMKENQDKTTKHSLNISNKNYMYFGIKHLMPSTYRYMFLSDRACEISFHVTKIIKVLI